MTSRLTRVLVVLLAAVPIAAQEKRAVDLKTAIDRLSAFDYPTWVYAARILRRMPVAEVVPALAQAARLHSDQFVRYRALIVLTAFNDRGTPDLMRALAALDPQVQRALIAEAGRGLDFFRSAVIEALGEHRAVYAIDTLSAVAVIDGPLQDDVILALGRIGGARAAPPLSSLTDLAPDVAPALQAAQCLLGDACAARFEWLTNTARSRAAPTETVRAAVTALRALAAHGDTAASSALLELSTDPNARLLDEVTLARTAVALRRPGDVVARLVAGPDDDARASKMDLLRQGFEGLEEDFAEEQFFAAARTAYWAAAQGSVTRTVVATLIDKLEFQWAA